MPKWEIDDDLVVSGMSGRFPESNNIEELKRNLYEGVDMLTEDNRRWKPGIFNTPKRFGKLKNVNKFDHTFFGISRSTADAMNPMGRILMETIYEAIFDAGFSPNSLRGRNIGVFVGCSGNIASGSGLSEEQDTDVIPGLAVTSAILANYVSHAFDFKGPSFTIDSACSSSLYALNEAFLAMKCNRCEAAIVAGVFIDLCIDTVREFSRKGLLSPDGACKTFDAEANGFAKSEGVAAVFLQRTSDAKRCYATVLHTRINHDGHKQGITAPLKSSLKELYKDVLTDLDMHPRAVSYVEAHGTGTKVGDTEETNAIAETYCVGRIGPLLIGSVKSNLGHTEGASGIVSMVKVLLSYEEGVIPPNLHFKLPRPEIPALFNGQLKVVTEPTPWVPGVAVINNSGIGATNSQVVLTPNLKEKGDSKTRTLHRLVLVSGRSESNVQDILKMIREEKFTDEALALLEDACKSPPEKMPFRGYTLIDGTRHDITSTIQPTTSEPRQVCFLFSGMGSQWSGMGKEMMKLDVFAKSIRKSAKVLELFGVDLVHLLTEGTKTELNHVVTPFVTITAVQIALVDMVRSLGISPDVIVGHSMGELGCAYADGCFTAEQAMLCSYWRGKCATMVQLIHGAMAVVDMTWEEAKRLCPENVFPVCHNAHDSVTISGPAKSVKEFVQNLNQSHIFAKEVDACNIAWHCKYIQEAGDIMLRELKKIVTNPVGRSSRWVSSSIPEGRWDEPLARVASGEYLVNNFTSPVLFYEAMTHVSKNALVIEFAPHGIQQSSIKRILDQNAIYIDLMDRKNPNTLLHCLEGIGRIFLSGMNPDVKNLYDPVVFPVPRGTARLSSMIQWDHQENLLVRDHEYLKTSKGIVHLKAYRGGEYEYLQDHKLEGRVVFPFTGYVYLAWKTLANQLEIDMNKLPVVIKDLSVYRATVLPKSGVFALRVEFLDSSGEFRITEGNTTLASGSIQQDHGSSLSLEKHIFSVSDSCDADLVLNTNDFYKEVRLTGYDYGPHFQGILEVDSNGVHGRIQNSCRWITCLDSALQMKILAIAHRVLLVPTRAKQIRINPMLIPLQSENGMPVRFDPYTDIIHSPAFEIDKINFASLTEKKEHRPTLLVQVFEPYLDSENYVENSVSLVEKYSRVCSTLAHRIYANTCSNNSEMSKCFIGFTEATQTELKEVQERSDERFVLLNVLYSILNETNTLEKERFVRKALAEHSNEMQNDMLTSSDLHERSLRVATGIIQENVFNSKPKILELSTDTTMYKHIQRVWPLPGLNFEKFTYTIARMPSNPLPECLLSEKGVNTVTMNFYARPLTTGNDLIIAKNLFTDCPKDPKLVLEAISTALNPNGFVLLLERTHLTPAERFLALLTGKQKPEQRETDLERIFQITGLSVISKKKDHVYSVMYLLRKQDMLKNAPVLINVDDPTSFIWVDDLKKEIQRNENEKRKIWLYSQSPASGCIGFMKCLLREPEGKYVRCFFNCDPSRDIDFSSLDVTNSKWQELFRKDLTLNVVKNGQLGTIQYQPLNTDPTAVSKTNAFLTSSRIGDLSSLKWFQNEPLEKADDEVLVEIYYSAINFKDVMLASGKLKQELHAGHQELKELILGWEFVGRDPSGQRVMGLSKGKALATSISVDKDFLLKVPDHWSMEEASTVVMVYAVAYYTLIMRGRLKEGESILIHSGAGGMGQAAINIALSLRCKVFVTVGSDEKRQFLTNEFQQLRENCIFSSRDERFESQIMKATKGKGVDVVMNSLAEEKLQASLRCVSQHGRFLEIGKYDFDINSKLGMAVLSQNISFCTIRYDLLLGDNSSVIRQTLDMVSQGIKKGVVRPLRTNVFNWDRAEQAFRFMTSGKHIGKVCLKIRDEEPQKMVLPTPVNIPCIARTYFERDKCYIITGGLGGLGFELAGWMVERGARKLVLTSRSQVKNNYQRLWLQRWKDSGVQVLISNLDISSVDGCRQLFRDAGEMGSIAGIFHLAAVLRDKAFPNMEPGDFVAVYAPKATGVHHLDSISREMCPDLRYFIVSSSLTAGVGNPGQTNNGFANSAMERIIEQRKEHGLPGLAIQFGPIGDVGVFYENKSTNEAILMGAVPQNLSSCLAVLDRLLQEDLVVVSTAVFLEGNDNNRCSNINIMNEVQSILGVTDLSSIDQDKTIGEIGMDSISGVQLKNFLESELEMVFSLAEISRLRIGVLNEMSNSNCSPSAEMGSLSIISENKKTPPEVYIPTESLVSLNKSEESRCVFFVHSLEGNVKMMESLASKVKRKVYGIQITEEVPRSTVQEIASYYVQKIKNIQPHGPKDLVGFSFGTLIALEMALILEKTEDLGQLVFVWESPDTAAVSCSQYVECNKKNDPGYQTDSIIAFLKQYDSNFDYKAEEHILKWTYTQDQCIPILQSFLREGSDLEELLKFVEIIYSLMVSAKSYKPSGTFEGNAILIRKEQRREDTLTKGLFTLKEAVSGSVREILINCGQENKPEEESSSISIALNGIF